MTPGRVDLGTHLRPYIRTTPDPSWKDGSKRGTHVVSIGRLKLYHGSSIQAPGNEVDVEMSDDEFAEHLHLAPPGGSSGKKPQRGRVGSQKREGKKEESEDDSEELGPSPPPRPTIVQPRQGTPGPGAPHRRYPKTPKPRPRSHQPLTPSPPQTRAQSAKKRAAQSHQTQSPTPSPPQMRAQSAKKQAALSNQSHTLRTARLDPGLNHQPRVVLTPIDTTATPDRHSRTPRSRAHPCPTRHD